MRWGGIGRGNNKDEDVGDGVIVCGVGKKISSSIGSSSLNTAGGRGPFK